MPALYFAYGSNMDRRQMRRRCPEASFVGSALLLNHRFVLDTRGAANVVSSAANIVHGVLWGLSDSDERALDRYEGVARGIYRKTHLALVRPHAQGTTQALVYIGSGEARGTPRSTEYMTRIVTAAMEHGFPDTYVAELREWLTTFS